MTDGASGAAQVSAVGRTAWAAARVRARESERPDRLFVDQYAAHFASSWAAADGDEVTATRRALGIHVVIRTRFYDDQLLFATADGCRQVVLLGAGLDTRAYRLPWPPETRLFKLDVPAVLRQKDRLRQEQLAQPRCERHPLSVDLRDDWPDVPAHPRCERPPPRPSPTGRTSSRNG